MTRGVSGNVSQFPVSRCFPACGRNVETGPRLAQNPITLIGVALSVAFASPLCDPNHKLPRRLSLSDDHQRPVMDKQGPQCGAAPFFADSLKIEGDHGQ